MKLIPLVVLTLSLTEDIKTQEHYTFPPQFQTPSIGLFSSDSSHFLPPESHTPVPLFPVKNINHFPFPYLPPSGSKTPSGFPKPFISTPISRRDDDNDDDEVDEDVSRKSNIPPYMRNQFNHTEWNLKEREKKEIRPIPRMANYQNNIDRIDMKAPYQPNGNMPIMPSPQQSSMPRNVIISDNRMNDRADLVKAASFPQYIQQSPGVFVSSTTEPAVPILRLSNEMDLDGSFSYEALGADQTHYVQHSRMENMGTDKEEQVVEGSYSYVGDNGQTYTVHYVADSNGFRASGDHLPVPPPIPEIIQRAVQYNLAEEAKKLPHLKSWQYDEQDNGLSENEKNHRFAVSPPRNLFTGRAPESFSHNFAQGTANSQNNLATAASTQAPVMVEYKPDQMKNSMNNGPISPQITFLASQGAHNPSMKTVQQNQQSMGRVFTTERPSMPQLINYDAGVKDPEDNKALWRWQYGLAVNPSQTPEKNTISRSFGEGDDVMINFSDMTPEQYTSMMRSQFVSKEYKDDENKGVSYDVSTENQYNVNTPQRPQTNDNFNSQPKNANKDQTESGSKAYVDNTSTKDNHFYLNTPPNSQSYNPENYQFQNPQMQNVQNQNDQVISTQQPVIYQYASNTFKPSETYESLPYENANSVQKSVGSPHPTIITQREFIPPSQTVTKSYDYEDSSYEPRRIKAINTQAERESNEENLKVIPLNSDKSKRQNEWQNSIETVSNMPVTKTPLFTDSTANAIKLTDFIVPQNTDNFKPLFTTPEPLKQDTTTTEESTEVNIKENMFLKNIFSNEKSVGNRYEQFNELENATTTTKVPERKTDKSPKYYTQYQPKSGNTIKTMEQKNKPMDMSQILTYITAKNLFESSKVHPKPLPTYNNFNYKYDDSFYDDEDEEEMEEQNTNIKPIQKQHPELRGNIKNYKVLQRNNSQLNHEQDKYVYIKRNLAPPPMKSANLPPLGRAGPSVKSYLPPIYV